MYFQKKHTQNQLLYIIIALLVGVLNKNILPTILLINMEQVEKNQHY